MNNRLSDALASANLVAVGTFATGLLLWAAGAFSLFLDADPYPWWGKLGVLVAALVIELSAQRRPGAALVAMSVLLAADAAVGPSLPLWIALSDVLYLGVVRGTAGTRRIVDGVGVVGTAAAAVAGTAFGDVKLGVLCGLVGVALLLSPIGYAHAVLAARRAADAEKETAIALAQSERVAALADERRRVSRDLHDTVAGHVSAIAILSEVARDAADPAPVVESIRANSLAALDELRSMIDVLAADGDEIATARWSALDPLIAAADAVGSVVTVRGDPTVLPRRAEAVATRIVGEALANATKHAPGTAITVEVGDGPDPVRLTVRNALPAGGPEPAIGRGLRNMAIRAESVGGHVDAGPVGGEWVVAVSIPTSRTVSR